jgi:ATP-binding cassette subfamily B multidrug efflux pump
MLRLVRYLKPYAALIVVTIVLLFVQANADLALPDYMSRIVNYGIQQGGVENAVPNAVRQSTMDKLVLFMSSDTQQLVLGDYTLVTQDSPDYDKLVQEYPALSEGPIYVLKDVDRAEIDRLNPILGRALVVVSAIEQMMENPSQAPPMGSDTGMGGFDLSKLPPGTDLFALLAQLPEAQKAQIADAIESRFASLGDSMINQMAVTAVKAEYDALGMDTGKLQTRYILRTGTTMLLISLLGGACTIAVGFLAARTAAGAARDIRQAVFRKVESFSSAEFDQFSTASLITRSTNDVTQVQMVIFMIMRMVFYAPIIGVGGVIRAIDKSASMWWIIALRRDGLTRLIAI